MPMMAPDVPAGWSISAQGVPIDPNGALHPEMVAGAAGASGSASDLPVSSMAVVGLAGYFLGKPRGQAGLWAAVGAGLGYYFRPIG
jgi:hypothetical protein